MFKCAIGHISDPREKMVKIITLTRAVVYSGGSKGSEIVEEIGVCAMHAEQLRKAEEEQRAKARLQTGLR